jgi:head-tail adaptor
MRLAFPPPFMLRHLLQFETLTTSSPRELNEINEPIETWVASGAEFGDVEWIGSREFPITQRLYAETALRFRVRYRSAFHVAGWSGVTRVRFDNRVWNVYPATKDTRVYASPTDRTNTRANRVTTRTRWSVIEAFVHE